jgi:hypothetical protein
MPNATRKNRPSLKRNNRGSRNLTGNLNRRSNRAAMNFINQRLASNLNGNEIRRQAANKNQTMRNRINRMLNNMGM